MMPILQNTPTWVFALLATLVVLGLLQSRPRSLPRRRLLALPLLLTLLSLAGVISAFGVQAAALLAWAAGFGATLALLHGRIEVGVPSPGGAETRVKLPGSWWPLALMLGLFCVKYAVGATLAMHPELSQSIALALAASAAYGVFSGAFVARGRAWWVASRAPRGLQPI